MEPVTKDEWDLLERELASKEWLALHNMNEPARTETAREMLKGIGRHINNCTRWACKGCRS